MYTGRGSSSSIGAPSASTSPPPPASVEPPRHKQQYLTASGLVRVMADGAVVKATMRPGAAGFAEAIFPDEPDVVIATELPNLALLELYPPRREKARRQAQSVFCNWSGRRRRFGRDRRLELGGGG